MYQNLKRECRKKGISRSQIASLWGVKTNTVGEKMNGKTRIYLEEAWKLQSVFFPEFKLEYLFESNDMIEEDDSIALVV